MSAIWRGTRNFLGFCGQRWYTMFALGVVSGAALELVKIHWTAGEVNFYTVFRRKQLKRRLDQFEMQLKMADNALAFKPVADGKV
uniref:Uncharacterized protein n=1 Tax=Plectus sambesii TaxID=2011161 RepID=A0A914XMK6_9BILA